MLSLCDAEPGGNASNLDHCWGPSVGDQCDLIHLGCSPMGLEDLRHVRSPGVIGALVLGYLLVVGVRNEHIVIAGVSGMKEVGHNQLQVEDVVGLESFRVTKLKGTKKDGCPR